MRYVVIDLEATCWENKLQFQRANQEIIEIGAVCITDVSRGAIIMDFIENEKEYNIQIYIKPDKYPELTEYCINLTGITQDVIDKSLPPRKALYKFRESLKPWHLSSTMVSWGDYDWQLLKKEMGAHGLKFPFE